MKNAMAIATLVLTGLFASATAHARCTTNPYKMGRDAAAQACDDIAQGWVPYAEMAVEWLEGGTPPTPERTCSVDDVIQCKNAMAQHLRENPSCADLIEKNGRLEDAAGHSRGTAKEIWRRYVTVTCNQQ